MPASVGQKIRVGSIEFRVTGFCSGIADPAGPVPIADDFLTHIRHAWYGVALYSFGNSLWRRSFAYE